MSGDLEDFLRRAAQRRQAKAAQGQAAQGQTPRGQAARSRPEYSNRKTERFVSADDADEVLMAEVVEDHEDSISVRMQRLEAAKRTAAEAEAELARRKARRSLHSATHEVPAGIPSSGNPAQDLLKLLRQPGGLQQAILLKEILDRPEHRW